QLVRRVGRHGRRGEDRLSPRARIHADGRCRIYHAEEAGLLTPASIGGAVSLMGDERLIQAGKPGGRYGMAMHKAILLPALACGLFISAAPVGAAAPDAADWEIGPIIRGKNYSVNM